MTSPGVVIECCGMGDKQTKTDKHEEKLIGNV